MKVFISYKLNLTCILCFQMYMCNSIQPAMAVIVYVMCSFSSNHEAATGNSQGPSNAEEMDTSLGTG